MNKTFRIVKTKSNFKEFPTRLNKWEMHIS